MTMIRTFFFALLSTCLFTIANGQTSHKNAPQGTYVLHKANTRGESRESWLLSKHTFSFNNYDDPQRRGFGALLVLNDDWVKAGAGFPLHHHDEMEIISIPLYGGMAHKDSKGAAGITSVDKKNGAYTVQLMTAGSGLEHSEFNASMTDSVRFLQIWVVPERRGLKPAYRQKRFLFSGEQNQWQTIIAPGDTTALHINQRTVFSVGNIDAGKSLTYKPRLGGGVYAFIIEGNGVINGLAVERRDGAGFPEGTMLSVKAMQKLRVLLMEVPLK
jgi:redox-sensitive bicupin YhaK (pirin superfamily)